MVDRLGKSSYFSYLSANYRCYWNLWASSRSGKASACVENKWIKKIVLQIPEKRKFHIRVFDLSGS